METDLETMGSAFGKQDVELTEKDETFSSPFNKQNVELTGPAYDTDAFHHSNI